MSDSSSNAFSEAVEALAVIGEIDMLDYNSFFSGYNDRSLLHYAAIEGDLAAARCLLRHGANPNVKSADTDLYGMRNTSWTPLHHAARNGDVPMCKLLLTAG